MSAKKYPPFLLFFSFFFLFLFCLKGFLSKSSFSTSLLYKEGRASPPLKQQELVRFGQTISSHVVEIQKHIKLKAGYTHPTSSSSSSSWIHLKFNRFGIWLSPQVLLTSAFDLEPHPTEDAVAYSVVLHSSPSSPPSTHSLHLAFYDLTLGISLFIIHPIPQESTLSLSLSKDHPAWRSKKSPASSVHSAWLRAPSKAFKNAFITSFKERHPSWFNSVTDPQALKSLKTPLYIYQSPPKIPSIFVVLGSAPFPLHYLLWAVGQTPLGTPLFNADAHWETLILRQAPLELAPSNLPYLLIVPKSAILKALTLWLDPLPLD